MTRTPTLLHLSLARTAEHRALLYKEEAETFEKRFQNAVDFYFKDGKYLWPDGELPHEALLVRMRYCRQRSQRELDTSMILHPREILWAGLTVAP